MSKQSDLSKIYEKIAHLRFAMEHSDDPKNFIEMIEEEEQKIREINEEDTLRKGQRGEHS